jgi:predicted ATPase/DNA-binding winged helix-turn-helix (wHTH) protein
MTAPEPVDYTFGDFRLNAGEPLLLRNGAPVPLQLKTLETLLVLVKRAGSLVTRDQLIDEVWPDAFVDENNLSQHIRTLRKALAQTGCEEPMIETVPRRGYRFLSEVRAVAPTVNGGDAAASPGQRRHLANVVGREAEIEDIRNILLRDDVRLLTMTGIGGTGKTTLARAVACEMNPHFADGVCFVELGAVTNPDLAVSTIAQSLGIKDTGSLSVLDVLKNFLRDRRMLLVVDNFEQVLPAAPILAGLIQCAPHLKILVTSRALLRLSIATEFAVLPLSFPDDPAAAPLEELSGYESVRLFVLRAQKVRPGFSLNDENTREIAEICARLEGLPLAIELAAARVRIISPSAILRKLENRLEVLTGGAADLPTRQQTVRGTVEWSYELLSETEKALFRRLAVFSGGFTFDAVEAVCGAPPGSPGLVPSNNSSGENEADAAAAATSPCGFDVLEGVTSLTEKSLIVPREQPDGSVRFRMLEIVREYALEMLGAAGELDALSRAHAAYFLDLGEKAADHLQRAESVYWLDYLEDEHDNLRSVLQWSIENDFQTAARLTAALRFFWLFHTHIMEGYKWTKLSYAHSARLPRKVRAKLLNALGVGARIQGDYASAKSMHSRALEESAAAGDKREVAFSNRGLGAVAGREGDVDAAQKFYERTLELSRELNDVSEVGYSLGSLGGLARIKGDNITARRLLAESLQTFRRLGQRERVITSLFSLGVIAYQEHNMAVAHDLFEEAMVIACELKDKIHISDLLDGIAAVTITEDCRLAAKIAGAAGNLRGSIGYELAPIDRLFRNQYVERIRSILGNESFAELYEEGTRLSLSDALDLALRSDSSHIKERIT